MGESEKPKKASNVLGLVSISYSRQPTDRAPRVRGEEAAGD